MVNLKRRSAKAYILLESLIAMSLFVFISQNLGHALVQYHRLHHKWLEQKEAYLVARMALQTGKEHLEINGEHVRIQKDAKRIIVYQGETVLIHVEKEP